ncbi:MAG: acetolactate decarboxylase [Phascolarctobacterium sp.]|nr:acetolactate decarboxylase [Phascolarctobacterium sp.]
MKKILLSTAALAVALATTCISADAANRETIYQVSTIQGLVASDYYPSTTVKALLKHGDIGIGTFTGCEGEMIVLDGKCYQGTADGIVVVPTPDTGVPFAGVTFFDKDYLMDIKNVDFAGWKEKATKIVSFNGPNSFYVGRTDGKFSKMTVRAIYKQHPPYKTLDKAAAVDQRVHELKNVSGTLVSMYCPGYVAGVNATGWHLHFISDDRKAGGHVIDFQMEEGTLILDKTDNFEMHLPNTDYFNKLDLEAQAKAVAKVEKGEGNK